MSKGSIGPSLPAGFPNAGFWSGWSVSQTAERRISCFTFLAFEPNPLSGRSITGRSLSCSRFSSLRRWTSIDEVGSNDVKKFPRVNDLGVLPELREMAFVARDQVIGSSRIRTFNKDIVGGIDSDWR